LKYEQERHSKETKTFIRNPPNLHGFFTSFCYPHSMTESRKIILVVDDEPNIVKVITGYLQAAGFGVINAADGDGALNLFRSQSPDFVILDLNLPKMDGVEVCKAIRRESNVPVMMLTARVDETDRLIGLELGADDYVIKPFSPREVVARVKTILRRSGIEQAPESDVIRLDDLIIDLGQHEIRLAGRTIDLTPTEFDLLVALARQPRRVFSRLQLLEQAMGNSFEGYERTIDAHIKNLRMKLEPDPRRPRYIQTVYGVGYRFDSGEHV
jgi:two-component system, OmpR family, alkaline phosphatase synthesis response regulator PhoP